MDDFISDAIAARPESAPAWLDSRREAGSRRWLASSMPTRRTESWKYTNLVRLERGRFYNRAETVSAHPSLNDHFAIDGIPTGIVFLNGRFSPELSGALPDGVNMVRLAEASADEASTVVQYLGSEVNHQEHLFANLNDAWLADGLYLHIAPNARIDTPIHCTWLSAGQSKPCIVPARLLVVAGTGSEASVIEHFCSDQTGGAVLTNSITEMVVEANACLRHFRLQVEDDGAAHIGGVHAGLYRDARLESFHLGLGGLLKRLDIVVRHRQERAHCDLSGIYLPRNRDHVDYHTTVEHMAPRCTTSETFRGIIGDSGRAVFNGRIHIHPHAQKTVAELSNKNLLTSDSAEVDTKPELEIYADDVQCAHGATVARQSEEALHYLQSRGIGRTDAETMLSYGFINELVARLPHEPLQDYIRPRLESLFGRQGLST